MGHLVQTPHRSRVTYSRLHRTLSRRVLNISREGDSTTSLGSLFQCSVTLRGKKFFLMFRQNFLCFSLCLLPLVLSLGNWDYTCLSEDKVLWLLNMYIFILKRKQNLYCLCWKQQTSQNKSQNVPLCHNTVLLFLS